MLCVCWGLEVFINKVLIGVITVSVALNIYLFLAPASLKQDSGIVPVLVNDSQLECLSRRGVDPLTPVLTNEVFGPEAFTGISISYFDLSNNPNGFEYEFSNCFYDRIIPAVIVTELDSALGLVNQLGYENYYFYKSAESETVTIYVKR